MKLTLSRRSHHPAAALLVLVTWLFLCPGVSAQQLFDSWTTESGLPQNSVNDIVQTPDGYLWLATHGGLVRFDGVRFVVFDRSTPGIASQRIRTLHVDRHGWLWAGAEDGTLIRHNDGRFTSFTHAQGLPHDIVVRIEEDDRGRLWITFRQGNIVTFDGRRFLTLGADRRPPDVRPPPVTHYLDLWWSARAGTLRVLVEGRVETLPLPGVRDASVTGASRDRKGNVWIRTRGAGVLKAVHGRIERFTTREGLPTDDPDGMFYEGRDGAVWFTEAGSSNVYLIVNGRRELMSQSGIRAFHVDRDGSTWIGTTASGLHRLRDRKFTVYTEAEGLSIAGAYSLLEDRSGAIWVGSGSGLSAFSNGRFKSYRGALPTGQVTCIYEDRAGTLWVGTPAGATRLEAGRFHPHDDGGELLKGNVWAIHQDRAHTYWFATDDGLVSWSHGRFTRYTTADGLSHQRITALYEDSRGALWIGTFQGATRLEDGVFTAYTERDGLVGNAVRAFHEDRDGILWIGTYDGGLYRLAGRQLTRVTRADGLHDNGIFQILEDDSGYLWMGSNRGISRVSRDQLNEFAAGRRRTVSASVFGTRDGLVSVEVNGGRQPAGLKAKDGRLWFPTMAGVAVVDPADVRPAAAPPSVIIEGVRLAGQPVDVSRGLRVGASFSAFEIRYTTPSFLQPEQIRFRYRLAGLDADWVDAGDRRIATFYGIPPGSYRFVVTASNGGDAWSPEGPGMEIEILPPFWRTWWFMALSSLGLISLAIAGHQHRVRRLRTTHEQQLAFSRQLIESQERERRRISNEMHDSLGQHATVMKKRTQAACEHIADTERVGSELAEIAALADQIKAEMREIAQDLRPWHLDRIGLSRTIERMAHRVGTACGLEVTTRIVPVDDVIVDETRIHVYRVVQEALQNVIKHAEATRMTIGIARTSDAVDISVEDDGIGVDAAVLDGTGPSAGGFGLMGIRERARLLRGTVEIHSREGSGTAVVLRLPLGGPSRG